MQLKVLVTSDRPDEYVGKKGLVKNQVITCQDVDPSGYRLLMPFDYTLSEDEKGKFAGKLQDKQIVVGVRELVPFGGRLRARGAIIAGPEGKNYLRRRREGDETDAKQIERSEKGPETPNNLWPLCLSPDFSCEEQNGSGASSTRLKIVSGCVAEWSETRLKRRSQGASARPSRQQSAILAGFVRSQHRSAVTKDRSLLANHSSARDHFSTPRWRKRQISQEVVARGADEWRVVSFAGDIFLIRKCHSECGSEFVIKLSPSC